MSDDMTVREACRRAQPIDGADAQALEGALSQAERERDDARAALANRWIFTLDDSVYEVSRGVRALAMPECSVPLREWVARLESTRRLEEEFRVAIRGELFSEEGEVELVPLVARDPIVLEVLDATRDLPRGLGPAVEGLLLGYDAREVGDFVRKMRLEPPEPLTEEDLFRRGLYSLAEGLAMQHSGASDPWPGEEVAAVRAYLQARLDSWRMPENRFDAAVREIVEAALEETQEEGDDAI